MANTTQDKQMSNTESSADIAKIGHALNLKTADIERIVKKQEESGLLFGEAAVSLGLVTDEDLLKALSKQFGFAYVTDNSALSQSLIAAHQPFSQSVEQVKSLRSQLVIRWLDQQAGKTLAVTSTTTQDNASYLVANLAIIFSQLNKKTLLIDANLRQPKQHQLFGIESKLGLTNILANRQGTYDLLPLGSLPSLTILPAGTDAPNPQELLARDGLTNLLTDLEKIYDVILVDTTPSENGTDYLSVVAKAKTALIITKKHQTEFSALQQLKSDIETADAQIVGSVIQE